MKAEARLRPARQAAARGCAALAVALLAVGCADPARTPEGTTREAVLQRLGPPTARYPGAGGTERLQYSRAPAGTEVTDIDVDAGGKVVSVVQALDEARFASTIQIGAWRAQDVLRSYGPPEMVTQVYAFDGDVWQWRYLHGNAHRLLYIYLDRAGVVQRYHVADDLRFDPPQARD